MAHFIVQRKSSFKRVWFIVMTLRVIRALSLEAERKGNVIRMIRPIRSESERKRVPC